MLHPVRGALLLWFLAVLAMPASATEPLPARIDALVLAKSKDQPASAAADDAEFLRRIYLDFAGRIPSVEEARAFLADQGTDKRSKLIDQLLAGPEYPRRMQELFHVLLMERLGDNPDWSRYLRESFAANKPWDQLVRELLRGRDEEATKGASFFILKRLENYGQNPVDYSGLTRDVGRLFLGMDLRCAQCHDHLFVKDYKQADFQGLHAFFQNTALQNGQLVEKPTIKKTEFMSVFRKEPKETAPRIPGLKEIEIPEIRKGDEYLKKPDPKAKFPGELRFSPLVKLAEQLPVAENPAFVRNIVNRLWFALMGRGLVHPLDLHHSDNPASHPELLDLLAQEFVAHRFDIKWLLGELARTQTYQRSSMLPEGQDKIAPETFLTALEKRLSAEQLLWSMLEAAGERQRTLDGKGPIKLEALQAKFVKAFANPRREPEDEISPSLKAALFLQNDDAVLSWLTPHDGNLIDRLSKLDDLEKLADELYLSVLTRYPTKDEKADVKKYLEKNGERRTVALGHLVWALLASTEFGVNH